MHVMCLLAFKKLSSDHRGDGGYIKIARGHHGCGITTDPVYAVFDGKHRFELTEDEAVPTA